jgi:aspartyl-tRNA(Asn)/glutamyl-tRNA(Gln) amidotransferase subunit A
MESTDSTRLTACEAAAALRAGRLTSVALTEAYLERIQAVDPAVRSYLAVTADVALEQADRADRRRADGEDGTLLGVPYALQDVFATAGITTTAGSRLLADYVPTDSSTVFRRLDGSGAVLLGKLNVDGFAMGASTGSSAFFPTRNPWQLAQGPGGSCDGAAAAVAADLATFAVGTGWHGGSWQAAARCGVVGLRPSQGRISCAGLLAQADGQAQVEPVTRDVRDAAVVLGALAGHDPADGNSLDEPVPDYTAALGDGALVGLRLGLDRERIDAGLDGADRAVAAAIEVLVGLGAVPVEVGLPPGPEPLSHCDVLVAPGAAGPAGYPGLTMPCGFADGLPVGLALLARPLDEATLLRVAHAYAATGWQLRYPNLTELNT